MNAGIELQALPSAKLDTRTLDDEEVQAIPGPRASSSRTTYISNLHIINLQAAAQNGSLSTVVSERMLVDDDRQVRKAQRKAFRGQFCAVCLGMMLSGWNDASTGPLLPRIQAVYHVGFSVVSLLFVCATIGFICGSFSNVYLSDRLGLGKLLAIGAAFPVLAYIIEAPAPPFPVFALAYSINGFGQSLLQAQIISYVACFKEKKELRVGLMQAAYGFGGLIAPLVATQFANLPHWSFHYLVSLGISIMTLFALVTTFRGMTQDEALSKIGHDPIESDRSANQHSKFRQIMTLRGGAVHLLAGFIFVYVGAEVTIGGWIVSYIVLLRGGGESSGYVASGFWGGILVGRLALIWLNKKIGERRAIFVYCLTAISLEFTIWFVPSLVGNAIAVSLIGFLLGPFYPIAMTHASRILPAWLLTSAVAWITGLGQVGSAILPFLTGAMSGRFGIGSLQPLLVSMLGGMLLIWGFVPKSRRMD